MEIIILIIIILGNFVLLGACLLLILYFSSAIFVWPPSIPSDRKTRNTMIAQVKEYFPTDAKINITDLGCGYGHLVTAAARNFRQANITGVELLKLPYICCKILCRRYKNISIVKGDMFKHDISNEDVIIYFYRQKGHMEEKLKEAKKGTVVISNNFPLNDREPKKVVQVNDLFAKRKIFVYII